MAESRFQLRLVRRRPPTEPEERPVSLASVARPTGHDDVLVWRLLGTNNRELGRSAEQFGSVDACLRAIGHLRAVLEESPSGKVSFSDGHPSGFAWWWTIDAGGVAAATAARTFSRQRECRANLETFMASAPVAQIVSALKGVGKVELSSDWPTLATDRNHLAQRRSEV